MSTDLECIFVEREKDKWYYILENYNAPKNSYDWLEYSTAYGPFRSFNSAKRNLDDNHANPGGYNVYQNKYYREFSEDRRKIIERLCGEAIKL